jgi:hypothetical protein
MGFNKYYVPEPGELVRQITEKGPSSFRENRNKIDAIIGSTESVRIVEHVFDMAEIGSPDSEILESLSQKFPTHFK